jgi:hypothetical protein
MYVGKKLIRKLIMVVVHIELNYYFPKDEGIFLNFIFCSLALCFTCYGFEVYKNKSLKVSKNFWLNTLVKFIFGGFFIYFEPYSMSTSSVVFYFNEITPLEYFNKLIEKRTEYLRLWTQYNQAVFNHNKPEDEVLREKYGKRLDKIEREIDKVKEKYGFADPDDFAHSEGSDNE